MVEYGNGVSHGAGEFGGSHGGGGLVDVGGQVGQAIGSTAHTISTLPPAGLLLLAVVVIIVGLALLHRAF